MRETDVRARRGEMQRITEIVEERARVAGTTVDDIFDRIEEERADQAYRNKIAEEVAATRAEAREEFTMNGR